MIVSMSQQQETHAVSACQKVNSDLKLVIYKRAHQPDHFMINLI